MSKTTTVLVAIGTLLVLQGCASSSTKRLYEEYSTCRAENMVVKTNDNGVIMLDENQKPVMVTKSGSCQEQMNAWNRAEDAKAKRAEREEKYTCGRGLVLWCNKWGTAPCTRQNIDAGRCRCTCVRRSDAQRALQGIW